MSLFKGQKLGPGELVLLNDQIRYVLILYIIKATSQLTFFKIIQ